MCIVSLRARVAQGPACAAMLACLAARAAGQSRSLELNNVDAGTTGYVTVADHPALEPANFTIEAWITPTGPGLGGTMDNLGATIFAKPNPGGSGDFLASYSLSWSPSTHWAVGSISHAFPSSGAVVVSIQTIPMNCSSHLAFSFDGEALRLYVNGQLDAVQVATTPAIAYGAQPVVIGASNFCCDLLRRFDGIVDDVRLWDHARTQREIALGLCCPLQGDEPGLIAYWPFAAASLADATGNGHDGTPVGTGGFSASNLELPPCGECPGAFAFCLCPDLDGDLDVGIADLLVLLGAWGTDPGGAPDFNCSGAVGVTDLLFLLSHWGFACPPCCEAGGTCP